MNRNLISLGLLVATFCFALGSNEADAFFGRRGRCCQNSGYQQRGNCGYQQGGNCGYQQGGNCGSGCGQNRNWGTGYSQAGNCCQPQAATATGCTTQTTGYAPQNDYINQPAANQPAANQDAAPIPTDSAVPMNGAPAPKPAL